VNASLVASVQHRAEALRARLPVPTFILGAITVCALTSLAIVPLFGAGMIVTGDTLHVWRIHEIGECLDDGQLPCRWVPDMGNGYGFPLFNYYPPLPYYAGHVLHVLGFSYIDTVDLLFVLGLLGAGVSMYGLARLLWGELGGIVSAVAYVYAPYLALDVYMRGALGELWALALVPAVLWATYKVVAAGVRYVSLLALFVGLLLLSHGLMTIVMVPAIALWAIIVVLLHRDRAMPAVLLGALGAVWGLGLAAFYTLPALVEGKYVQLENLTEEPLYYADHFVSVSDLFLRRSADYSFLLGSDAGTPVQIGWFHWAVAGLSVLAAVFFWRRRQPLQWLSIVFFGLAFTIGTFMTVSASESIWDTFDSLRFLQFPWRYLGLVSFGAAGLAGAWVAALRDRVPVAPWGLTAVLAGLFIGSGLVFFDPVFRFDVEDDDLFVGEDLEFYRQGSITDYLPEAVEEIPDPPRELLTVVEGQAAVLETEQHSSGVRGRIDAPVSVTVEAAAFEFPRRQVRIDGDRVPHEVSEPYGLVRFIVPAGVHDVEVGLQDTGIRQLANAISLVSWGVLAIAGLVFLVEAPVRKYGRGSRT
jgi:hypothetical protein